MAISGVVGGLAPMSSTLLRTKFILQTVSLERIPRRVKILLRLLCLVPLVYPGPP